MSQNLPEWDLSPLYESIKSEKLAADRKLSARLADEFAKKYSGKIEKLSAEELAQAISEYEKLQDLMGRLGSYAQLVYAGNMTSPENAVFYQNISEELTVNSSKLIFFTLTLNRMEDSVLEEHLKKPLTLESLRELLDKQIFHTTITKNEDALLRINKLNDCMPASFYEHNHSLYGKWYARYVETGIAINDVLL